MRAPLALASVCTLIGVGLCLLSLHWPVYISEDAPERLSNELASKHDFKRWYAQLPLYETPHKRVSDWGRGLVAAGIALAVAYRFMLGYERHRWMRTPVAVLTAWLGLWALRVPLTLWYFQLREDRFDYPVWGDSLGIPVFGQIAAWIVGATFSLIVLAILCIRHPLPDGFHPTRPKTIFGWIRAGVLGCWIALLLLLSGSGISDGDEGTVFCCFVAAAILAIFLSASWAPSPQAPEARVRISRPHN